MSDAPRKAPLRWILAPYILAVLLAAGLCGYWFVMRDRIETGLDEQAAILRQRGYEVSWTSREVGGFPFLFDVTLNEPRFAQPGGWGLSAPSLQAETSALLRGPIVFVAPDGLTLRRPRGRAYAIKGEALRLSISHRSETVPRVSVEGVKLKVASAGDGPAPALPTINLFSAHLRADTGDTARLFIRADEATVGGENLLARIADGKTVTVAVEGTLTHASQLHGSSWPALVGRWAAAGGAFEIKQGGVSAGDAVLSLAPSRITADADGRVSGAASVSLTRASDSMAALGAIGVLPGQTAAAASGLALLQGGSSKPLEVTLTFQGGQTLVGPLPLGPAPRLY